MKNNVRNGAFVLIVSGLICKLFGGLFRLPLTNIISIEGIGMFQMVMSLYSLALVFVSSGVTNSLSKLVSSARARGDQKIIGSYLKYGIIFSVGLSILISLFLFFFSSSIASVQGITAGKSAYIIVGFILPIGALVGVIRGLMQGYNNMVPTAISQIIEQVAKFIFGLIFAYLFAKNNSSSGILGAFIGILLSEVFAAAYLCYRSFFKEKYEFGSEGRKEFFKASLPLTFGGVILPLVHAVEALCIVGLLCKTGITKKLATSLYGLQTGMVGAILNFPLIISVSVAMALLPSLSYLSAQNDRDKERGLVQKSFLAMWFILLPLVFGLMSVAGVLYPLVYPHIIGSYLKISLKLTIFSGISIILTAIMQFLLSILQAKGFFNYSLIISAVGGGVKLLLLFILAPLKSFSIFALPISNILFSFVIIVLALFKLYYLVRLPIFETILPLLSAAIMFMVVKIFLSFVGGAVGLILSVMIGMIIYFAICFPLTKSYAKEIYQIYVNRQ